MIRLIVAVLALRVLSSDAFLTHPSSSLISRVASSSSSSSSLKVNGVGNVNNNNMVVISPPGGVGEMTAIESAKLGGNVKWFIVSPPAAAKTALMAGSVSISAETMSCIHDSGGSLDLAYACTTDLLQSSESSSSNEALIAMGTWCNAPSCIIATYDGINVAIAKSSSSSSSGGGGSAATEINDMGTMIESMRAGIRLAAREASKISGSKRTIAILATGEEQETTEEVGNNEGGVSGMVGSIGSMLTNLVGGGKNTSNDNIPRTLKEAIISSSTSTGTTATTVIRHGELFGAPESSPDSSPFMGGPRRDPVVRDMYAMRSVRIDPSSMITSGAGGGLGYRSNRLTVAEATARIGLGRITSTTTPINPTKTMEISVSSFPGTDGPSNEEWENEFRRVISEINTSSTSRSTSVATTLFLAEFASVPSPKRLAAWLAEKWAPAVLRSYDIAGIRVGSRPVFANVIPPDSSNVDDGATMVEIVWQDLVNFNPVTSGRMYIAVSSTGISATRGPGSASSGFGTVALVPLAGEEILVKRLADAASQAVEKGLAAKAIPTKKTEEVVVEAVAAPSVTTIFTPPDDRVVPSTSSDKSGPRNTGARRSSERTRGSKITSSSVNYDGE